MAVDAGLSILDRVPLDRINEQARAARPGRALLTILAALFFAIGWVAGKTITVIWLSIAWSFAAVKVGWQEARPKPTSDT
jgi:fatty acid desaturase